MESYDKSVLSEPDRVLEIVRMMTEMLAECRSVQFYGLVYERIGDGEYVVVLYEGDLLSIVDIGFDSSFKLYAAEKYLCIKNAADINSPPSEVDQAEAFADFMDPDRVVDEEWIKLEDWETAEIEVPVKYLDTYGLIPG